MSDERRKILFVDDDANLLASYARQLRKRYDVETAESGAAGLRAVGELGPFCVIVSDFRMPGIDGLQFLSACREVSPDSSRILLTGFAELEVAIKAVNEGSIFRLLTKPCHPEILVRALSDGVRQYELVQSERELLEETVRGSVRVLSDVIGLTRPDVFGQISRIMPLVRKLSILMDDPQPWMTETAAMLCLLGFITLPEKLVRRVNLGRTLTSEEYAMFAGHAEVASRLVMRIPRMEEVGRIIAYQDKFYDGRGLPQDAVAGDLIPLGARILKVLLDFDRAVESGMNRPEALTALGGRHGWYDPRIVSTLGSMVKDEGQYCVKTVNMDALQESMVLAEDIMLERGGKLVRVLARGQEMSRVTIAYLRKYQQNFSMSSKVRVIIPWECVEDESASSTPESS
ncbi:response regulator RpfG family c-di-GMP phosphodiesterase [Desulfobaculum xiamenense]|uniref:Response regulator RpfG family c-di-GMP phosphodiesterase n=1 Tax=Desulfobaculum xiamenense TaxID=995050 RepID=A0A846QNG7_9BACT|nr:HD domain-containing phosphohydrolase [Desulfobaculum xiamenense]NJB67813.1 response regulator RpfG family c-di-GMP phosphodiesterase [Desulfobaculum xiamenense]